MVGCDLETSSISLLRHGQGATIKCMQGYRQSAEIAAKMIFFWRTRKLFTAFQRQHIPPQYGNVIASIVNASKCSDAFVTFTFNSNAIKTLLNNVFNDTAIK